MHLSVVIPAFNEAAKIGADLRALCDFLAAQPFAWEILVVNDGSTDETVSVVTEFSKCVPGVRLLSYSKNRGKGYAVRYGVAQAKGEVIAFLDAGSCVPARFFTPALALIDEGFDLALASRRLPQAVIRRAQPWHRRAGSQLFWKLIQLWMGLRVSDTQCGFKIYRAKAAHEIFSKVVTEGFMFDIEALLTARKLGLRAAEFPVEWANDADTRYRVFQGTFRNFLELLLIKWRAE